MGSLGTIVLGVWLAIALDDVKVWDGWVIAAIVFWVVASEAGRGVGTSSTSRSPVRTNSWRQGRPVRMPACRSWLDPGAG